MKLRDFLEKWGLSSLKLNIGFLEGEFSPTDPDREAAWELYVELLTRVTTQYIPEEHGEEKVALESIHEIFPVTREILKRHGSGCGQFARIAIPVLNQIIRPFTSKWHGVLLNNGFQEPKNREEFRDKLRELQQLLLSYATALSVMANVEDLTQLEQLS